MTGQEIIDMIKKMNLENEVMYIDNSTSFSGEINFSKVTGIEKEDEWYHRVWFTKD